MTLVANPETGGELLIPPVNPGEEVIIDLVLADSAQPPDTPLLSQAPFDWKERRLLHPPEYFLLDRTTEVGLWRIMMGIAPGSTETARDTLFQQNWPAIAKHAGMLANPYFGFQECVQAGAVGAWEFTGKFDPTMGGEIAIESPSLGRTYTSYMGMRVRGAMLDAIRENHPLGATVARTLGRVAQAEEQGWGVSYDDQKTQAVGRVLSLDAPMGRSSKQPSGWPEDDIEVGFTIASSASTEEVGMHGLLWEQVGTQLDTAKAAVRNKLSGQKQAYFDALFYAEGSEVSQVEIAAQLGVDQSRVSQEKRIFFTLLREEILKNYPDLLDIILVR